ncbi:MAG: sulfatase [Verrucomicrobiota bacterium]
MTHRLFAATVALLFSFLASFSQAEEPPNIILILTDDHGWSQLSALMDPDHPDSKSDYLQTPHMARIMEGGMRFTSGYSPAPLCTPTRRSILCGTSAARSGTEFRSDWIPADHLTIPKALKQANADYRCAHFGKWGEQMISTPEESGYDASDGINGNNTGGMPKTLGVKGGHGDGPPHFIDNEDPKRTDSVTQRSVEFIQEQNKAGHPFYLQVSYYAQHLSVVCREETLAKWDAKGTPDRGYPPAWAAMLEELDDGVGRLLDTLDELEIADNTYVFFTADNGGRGTVPGGDDSRTATNHPLTGAKHSLYEGGIRVPFFASGPGVAAGSVCRTPVVGYDYLATFYDLAGGTEALGEGIDGVSFKPALMDPKAAINRSGALIFHRPGKLESTIRKGNFKLRLTWNPDNSVAGRELYNVGSNPTEEGNEISSKNPEKADSLQRQLLVYLESVDAEKVPPPKPKKKPKK